MDDEIVNPLINGWICARCGMSHSPYVSHCNCAPPTFASSGRFIISTGLFEGARPLNDIEQAALNSAF
jgi:hypothetical protein